jgi:hypothetical protein
VSDALEERAHPAPWLRSTLRPEGEHDLELEEATLPPIQLRMPFPPGEETAGEEQAEPGQSGGEGSAIKDVGDNEVLGWLNRRLEYVPAPAAPDAHQEAEEQEVAPAGERGPEPSFTIPLKVSGQVGIRPIAASRSSSIVQTSATAEPEGLPIPGPALSITTPGLGGCASCQNGLLGSLAPVGHDDNLCH